MLKSWFASMSDEKLKRVVSGAVVAGTLLLLILVFVIIYQFISIGIKNAQIKKYNEEIAQYEELVEQLGDDLAYYSSDYAKYLAAQRNGYDYEDSSK